MQTDSSASPRHPHAKSDGASTQEDKTHEGKTHSDTIKGAITSAIKAAAETDGLNLRQPIRVIVAFSGGPDSLALLWGTAQQEAASSDGSNELRVLAAAAHLDHGLDADSPRRATRAATLATEIGAPINVERLSPFDAREGGIEAAARELRYHFLERLRQRQRAHYILTGHHADDQIETLLLRLLYGTGLDGLAGIQPRRGRVLRPLLGLRRQHIEAVLQAQGLEPTVDPTNHESDTTRNRLRNQLLPYLEEKEPGLCDRLLTMAQRSQDTRRRLDRFFEQLLKPTLEGGSSVSVERGRLEGMAPPVLELALASLHRLAGAPYPGTAGARRELRRQLAAGRQLGIDCGGGWAWSSEGAKLMIAKKKKRRPET